MLQRARPLRCDNGPVSKKAKKPPIQKKKLLARLERAQEQRLFISVRRWIPNSDRIDGFVVGIGAKWVAIANLGSGIHLDGWCLLRIKDIQSVYFEPEPDCFEVKALQAREEWPPVAPPIDLDSSVGVITSTSAATVMLSVHVEFDRPDICWVGSITAVNQETFELLEVSTRASWNRGPRPVDFDDLTRVDFGAGYEEALSLVAGPPPDA